MIRLLLAASICGVLVGSSSVWPAPAPLSRTDDEPRIGMVARARVAAAPMVHAEVRATVFGYVGDRHAGGAAAFLGREIDPDIETGDVCIAHRTLPGDSEVWITYRGRRVLATVCDRGPWGCDIPDGQRARRGQRRSGHVWLCIYRDDVGDHRTDIDLSPRLAHLLGLEPGSYGRRIMTLEYQRW